MSSQGCIPSGSSRGESIFLLFPASRESTHFLVHYLFIHYQSQQLSIFFPPCGPWGHRVRHDLATEKQQQNCLGQFQSLYHEKWLWRTSEKRIRLLMKSFKLGGDPYSKELQDKLFITFTPFLEPNMQFLGVFTRSQNRLNATKIHCTEE